MKKQNAIPHDTTAESYVIGSLMLHSDLIDEWDELNAEYFFLPAHQSILAAIVAIRAGGGSPDLLTVTQRLGELGQLENVGGPGGLTEMYSHGGGRDLNYHIDSCAATWPAVASWTPPPAWRPPPKIRPSTWTKP